jgi:hypothetical protein
LTASRSKSSSKARLLNNRNKTVGGQASIDIERMLSYQLSEQQVAESKAIYTNQHGRRYLAPDSVIRHSRLCWTKLCGILMTACMEHLAL